MRLFSLMNAGAIDGPDGHFEPDPHHGGFDLPGELADRLRSTHYRGKPAWETEVERNERLHGEESARRRDPETLYNAVADIANVTKQLAGLRLNGPDAAPNAEVAALSEQVRALTARLAAIEGQASALVAEDGDGDGDGDGGATAKKPSRSRRAPAAGA